MNKILNAFSLNMISGFPCTARFDEVPLEKARELAAGLESAVGHADTAAVFSSLLGIPVAVNRTTVTLQSGDVALVGQLRGPRLPEGCKTLPDGATIQWILVTVE